MILTGKAKEDFDKWNYDNDFGYIDHEPTSLVVHFEDLDDFLRNTIIIEWLDSLRTLNKKRGVLKFKDLYISSLKEMHQQYSILEMNKKIIIKANEIYNEKNR